MLVKGIWAYWGAIKIYIPVVLSSKFIFLLFCHQNLYCCCFVIKIGLQTSFLLILTVSMWCLHNHFESISFPTCFEIFAPCFLNFQTRIFIPLHITLAKRSHTIFLLYEFWKLLQKVDGSAMSIVSVFNSSTI